MHPKTTYTSTSTSSSPTPAAMQYFLFPDSLIFLV